MILQGNRAERIVGIFVSAIFAFFAFSSLANAAGEFEPNESRGNPAGPVTPGATINATIDKHDDSDWYKFYVADPGTVVKFTATKTNGLAKPWHVEFVENLHGDDVAFHSFGASETTFELTGTVDPGKYFAWVLGSPEADATGLTYSLKFTQGLSDFEAIQSGCAVSQGRLDTFTGQVAATAELVARQTKVVSKAAKSLAKAKKKKAGTRSAKAKKKKAITKAKKAVKSAQKVLSGAKAVQAKVQADYDKAKSDSEKLCGVTT